MAKKYVKDIPHLVKEYNFDKNKNIDFEKLTHGSEKKVWWTCSYKHKWQATVKDRTCKNSGCPYCSNKKSCKDNCLSTTHPKLAREWSNNNKLKPTEVIAGSHKEMWWKCHKGHEWKEKLVLRKRGLNCPYCSNRRACKDNCLKTKYPELSKEWDIKRNKLDTTDITATSGKKAWWKCEKGHTWDASPHQRISKNTGCPYCSNQKVCKDNCLSTTHPHLLKEWDYEKNNIKPTEIVAGSTKKVWWKCNACKEGWKSKIVYRKHGHNCPYCNHLKASESNNICTTHPHLIKEWSNRNKIKPTEVTYGSAKKIWWKCKKCKWEWECQTSGRVRGRGCPKCKESYGEKLVAQILNDLKKRYKRQHIFKELGNYKFDFALFKKYARKPYAVIEYHGQQHYQVVDFSGRNQLRAEKQFKQIKKRDKIKKQYCLDNNIKYLEIPYSEKDNIEKLIEEFIKKYTDN